MNKLSEKVVAITGAGSGIGRCLAQQMARKGARLALSDFNESMLSETMDTLPAGTDARPYTVDVSSRESVFAHAEQVVRDFGSAHYVINNAGATVVGTFEHLTIEEIEWQLAVNLWGVIYGTKAFLPFFLRQNEGCIVNISSVFGIIGYPCQSAYNISKFGVRGLTEALWSELAGTGVRAVSVHPGGIKTNIDASGRRSEYAGDAEDREWNLVSEKLLRTAPEDCAADIIRGLERGKRRILTGHRSKAIYWMSRLLPNSYPSLLNYLK